MEDEPELAYRMVPFPMTSMTLDLDFKVTTF